MICYFFEEPSFLFFSSDAPELLYYSHLSTFIISLALGLFVFLNSKKTLLNSLLLAIIVCFNVWVLANLIAWTSVDVSLIAFIWPLFSLFESLISILAVYFTYVFLDKKDVGLGKKLVFFILLLPVFIFAHTNLNISGFDIVNCDAFMYENWLFNGYYNLLGFISILWIFFILIDRLTKAREKPKLRKKIILFGVGIELFLLFFLVATFLASYLVKLEILPDTHLEMYGLFGMIIFIIMITVLIVRFQAFNSRISLYQALLSGTVVLVASQYAFLDSGYLVHLISITLVLVFIISVTLSKSMEKELEQKEQITKLVTNLKQVNHRLEKLDKEKSEFVSIASHQLKSPLTAIGGYASLLRDGDYGVLPKETADPLNRIYSSARKMAVLIEEYLDISRIESGNMKFNFIEFNLKKEVESVCDDLRLIAAEKELKLSFENKIEGEGVILADLGKINQVVHNLVNNAIKYTENGQVKVVLRDNLQQEMVFIDVIDTGIGMDEKALANLFQKFSRTEEASKLDIRGAGLGLYTAEKLLKVMGGEIFAFSDGTGKGSCFTISLPLVR